MGNSASSNGTNNKKKKKTSIIQVAPAPGKAKTRSLWKSPKNVVSAVNAFNAVRPQTPQEVVEETVEEVIPPEREVLEKFFCSTQGDSWRTKENWISDGALSSFYGVIFAFEKVIGLGLTENDLSGELPAEIGYLRSLQYMYAQDNNIRGTLPASIAQMTSLCVLELNGNMLEGTVCICAFAQLCNPT